MPEFINTIPRGLLEKYFENDPRLISAFENQSAVVEAAMDAATGTVQATESLQNATVVTLSTNAVFNNEFVLGPGDGTKLTLTADTIKIDVDETVARAQGHVTFTTPGGTGSFVSLQLPASGTLVSDVEAATLLLKTLDKPKMQGLGNYTTEANAAAAGVPVGGVYRDGTTLKIRTV